MYLHFSNVRHATCVQICIVVFVIAFIINRNPQSLTLCVQDLVGEAPLHKAARSGSLECIQVLLIAGAKPQ